MRTIGVIRCVAILAVLACALPVCADQSYAPQAAGQVLGPDPASGDPLSTWQSVRDLMNQQSATPDSLSADAGDPFRMAPAFAQNSIFDSTSAASNEIAQSRSADLRLCILFVLAAGAVVLFFTSEGFRRYLTDLYSPLNWS